MVTSSGFFFSFEMNGKAYQYLLPLKLIEMLTDNVSIIGQHNALEMNGNANLIDFAIEMNGNDN